MNSYQPDEVNYDHIFKIVLTGHSGVGKSCLMRRFTDDKFSDDSSATIGVDFKIRTIEVDGKKIKLQIWDTAGQERFRTINSIYYHGAAGIIVVYDITSKLSYANVDGWLDEIQKNASDGVSVIMIGNKSDLTDKREVATNDAWKFAQSRNMTFLETSAKDNRNVEEAFVTLSREILARTERSMDNNPGSLRLHESTFSSAEGWFSGWCSYL